jgi:ABC-type branched-subunit amino acid transport system substrate-binding protein
LPNANPSNDYYRGETGEVAWLFFTPSGVKQQTITYSIQPAGIKPIALAGGAIYYLQDGEYHSVSISGDQFVNLSYNVIGQLSKSGDFSNFGLPMSQSAGLAAEKINNIDSNNFPLRMTMQDDQSSESKSAMFMANAADDVSVRAIIGGTASKNTLVMAPIAVEKEIPLFVPASTSIDLASYTKYVVKVAPLDNYQIDAISEVLLNEQLFGAPMSKVFLLVEDSPYGSGFLDLKSEEGIEIVDEQTFSNERLNVKKVKNQILSAIQNGAQAGVLAGYQNDAKKLFKALAKSGDQDLLDFPWVISDAASTNNVIQDLSSSYEAKIYGLSPSIANQLTKSIQFKEEFETKFETTPEWYTYYANDAVVALHEALKKSTDQSRNGIWNAVSGLGFDGVTGKKWFDEKGMLISACYDIKVKSGTEFLIIAEEYVKQPNGSNGGNAKTIQNRNAIAPLVDDSGLVFEDFIYQLYGNDARIGHMGGEAGSNNSWIARSRDLDIGWVVMAYYEDINRGLTTDGQAFGFRDANQYNLILDMSRIDLAGTMSNETQVLEIKLTSVCRYHDANNLQQFATKELLRKTLKFTDWPNEALQYTIPVEYQSAAPVGVNVNAVDQLLNWEIRLQNAAHQEISLKTIIINTPNMTAIEEFELY